uniref:Translationally-controlled tumor protein homolog n=1 Tax=Mola mola TaxID=94237 RepID=A0A3Q3W6K4_MOLML
MIIYKCAISNDEMFSDSFKISTMPDDMFYEVEGKIVTRKEGIDESLIGANPSAEETVEVNDDSCKSGVDIILNHGLLETGFNKESYWKYMKDFAKAVKAYLKENNPERVDMFVNNVKKAAKTRIVSNMDNFQFYTGSNMNPAGTVGALNYREDGVTPYMLFYKDGLIWEKFVSTHLSLMNNM